jgi:protein-tyrosine sulfotransferase
VTTTVNHHNGSIILGCPRSGTTLLRRLLGAHPNISAPGETYILTSSARFLASDPSIDGMQVGVVNGLGFLGVEEEALLARLRAFAVEFLEEHAAKSGKGRWLEKTAVDAFHVDAIERIFGDHANFICVTRHGLDVVCSMEEWCRKSGAYPRELHVYIQQHSQPLIAFAHAWVAAVNSILDFAERHPQNTMTLRYEDLVSAPEEMTNKILGFIGEPVVPDLLETALSDPSPRGFSDWKTFSKDRIDASSIQRWRKLPPATIRELAAVLNPTLTRCGYEPIRESPVDTDENARRRYEMGLTLQSLKR